MANKTPNLLFKKAWVDFLKEEFKLDPALTMKVFFAICDYAYGDKIPEDVTIRLAIGAIRKEIDQDRVSYNDVSEKRRNARKVAIENMKSRSTNVDFVDDKATNLTNLTNVDNIIDNNRNECNDELSLSNDNNNSYNY